MNTEPPISKSNSAPFLGPLIGINLAGLFLIVCLILIIRYTRCCGLRSKRRPVIQRSTRIIHQVSGIYCSENPRNDRIIQNNLSREYVLDLTMEETSFMSPPSYQMSTLEVNNRSSLQGPASVSSADSSTNSYRSLSVSTLQTDLSRVAPIREPPPPYKEADS